MANRRMFSMKIVDTDAFMDMPISSQLLYFHLAMRADDDGFVSNPKKLMRMVGASDDDYKVLIAKKFIIPFESGICVIKHWLIHNLIRNDRYTETQYTREKSRLLIDEKTRKYSLVDGQKLKTIQENVIPNDNQWPTSGMTQYRVGKGSIEKTNTDEKVTNIVKFTEEDKKLACLLLDLIRKNTPTFKEPSLDNWSEHVRLMRVYDKRTPVQIEYVIKWCQHNSFWKANILSTKKLREKFDTLVSQIKRDVDISKEVKSKVAFS